MHPLLEALLRITAPCCITRTHAALHPPCLPPLPSPRLSSTAPWLPAAAPRRAWPTRPAAAYAPPPPLPCAAPPAAAASAPQSPPAPPPAASSLLRPSPSRHPPGAPVKDKGRAQAASVGAGAEQRRACQRARRQAHTTTQSARMQPNAAAGGANCRTSHPSPGKRQPPCLPTPPSSTNPTNQPNIHFKTEKQPTASAGWLAANQQALACRPPPPPNSAHLKSRCAAVKSRTARATSLCLVGSPGGRGRPSVRTAHSCTTGGFGAVFGELARALHQPLLATNSVPTNRLQRAADSGFILIKTINLWYRNGGGSLSIPQNISSQTIRVARLRRDAGVRAQVHA